MFEDILTVNRAPSYGDRPATTMSFSTLPNVGKRPEWFTPKKIKNYAIVFNV